MLAGKEVTNYMQKLVQELGHEVNAMVAGKIKE